MSEHTTTTVRTLGLTLLVGLVVVTAGCTGGSGTQTFSGSGSQNANVSLHSAKVVDGTLRRITVTNNASNAISGGTWNVHLNGTSNKNSATYDTTAHAGSIPAGGSKQITIAKGSQPDWQDGAKLTIRATSPQGDQDIMLTVRPQ